MEPGRLSDANAEAHPLWIMVHANSGGLYARTHLVILSTVALLTVSTSTMLDMNSSVDLQHRSSND